MIWRRWAAAMCQGAAGSVGEASTTAMICLRVSYL